MSHNRYDQTVCRLYGLTPVDGEIGCEIEVEGTRLPHVYANPETGGRDVDMRYHWSTTRDGSLRENNPGDLSAEYVLRAPVNRKDVDKVFDYFDKKWAEAEATSYNSYRTSVHVHLNVGAWPMRRVYSFLAAYCILEEVLVDFADGGTGARRANRFCLRIKDAEQIIDQLQAMVKNDFRGRISRDHLKYGAVNIAALSHYGSLEFRSLRGTVDTKLIRQWIDILLSVKDYAEKFDNPSDVIADFSQEGPEVWASKVLGKHMSVIATVDFNTKLFDGMRLAQDIGYATNWQPYKAPEMYTSDFGETTIRVTNGDAIRQEIDRMAGTIRTTMSVNHWATTQPAPPPPTPTIQTAPLGTHINWGVPIQ